MCRLNAEDVNENGVLDPGEDWDGDGHLDILETRFSLDEIYPNGVAYQSYDSDGDGRYDMIISPSEEGEIELEEIRRVTRC